MKLIDFSENMNPFGPPDGLTNILTDNISSLYHYPSKFQDEITDCMAKFWSIEKENIFVGNGSTDILFNLPKFLRKGKILITIPTFWQYLQFNKIIKRNKVESFFLKENENFQINWSKFELYLKDVKNVYLCNPNNPTSTILDRTNLIQLINTFPNINFIIDETYLIFRKDYFKESLLNVVKSCRNLYIVTSVTKFFSIPGLRIGFLCSAVENINKYKKNSCPYSVSPLVVEAIQYLINNTKFINKSKITIEQEKIFLFKEITEGFKESLKVFAPGANFLLVKILTKQKSFDLCQRMLGYGIKIRDCSFMDGLNDSWIRISVGSRGRNIYLINKLYECIIQ